MLLRLTIVLALFISGCAGLSGGRNGLDDTEAAWSGRFALTTHTDPSNTVSASFELRGTSEKGELLLLSPIGNTLAQLQWKPGRASLRQEGRTEEFDSLENLFNRVVGTSIPVAEFFDWFAGKPVNSRGWTVNLDEIERGRLSAHRSQPEPQATVRVVLDRQPGVTRP